MPQNKIPVIELGIKPIPYSIKSLNVLVDDLSIEFICNPAKYRAENPKGLHKQKRRTQEEIKKTKWS